MTTKHKVRKNFDIYKEYSVDVSKCTEEEKKEVQQAFFDAGFPWESQGKRYQHLTAAKYTNMGGDGCITQYCLFNYLAESCNMTAEEFLELVYESEKQGHVHAENMALYAEDAQTHAEPWKLWECSIIRGEWVALIKSPAWRDTLDYRRKPKTRFVHGVEIPVFNFSPEVGKHVYVANVGLPEFFASYRVSEECTYTQRMIDRGLLYPYTEEGKQAAILHAKAMLAT